MEVRIEFKEKVNSSLIYEEDGDCTVLVVKDSEIPTVNSHGFLEVTNKRCGAVTVKPTTWWFNLDNILQMKMEG